MGHWGLGHWGLVHWTAYHHACSQPTHSTNLPIYQSTNLSIYQSTDAPTNKNAHAVTGTKCASELRGTTLVPPRMGTLGPAIRLRARGIKRTDLPAVPITAGFRDELLARFQISDLRFPIVGHSIENLQSEIQNRVPSSGSRGNFGGLHAGQACSLISEARPLWGHPPAYFPPSQPLLVAIQLWGYYAPRPAIYANRSDSR